jgi:hypothetical protein
VEPTRPLASLSNLPPELLLAISQFSENLEDIYFARFICGNTREAASEALIRRVRHHLLKRQPQVFIDFAVGMATRDVFSLKYLECFTRAESLGGLLRLVGLKSDDLVNLEITRNVYSRSIDSEEERAFIAVLFRAMGLDKHHLRVVLDYFAVAMVNATPADSHTNLKSFLSHTGLSPKDQIWAVAESGNICFGFKMADSAGMIAGGHWIL